MILININDKNKDDKILSSQKDGNLFSLRTPSLQFQLKNASNATETLKFSQRFSRSLSSIEENYMPRIVKEFSTNTNKNYSTMTLREIKCECDVRLVDLPSIRLQYTNLLKTKFNKNKQFTRKSIQKKTSLKPKAQIKAEKKTSFGINQEIETQETNVIPELLLNEFGINFENDIHQTKFEKSSSWTAFLDANQKFLRSSMDDYLPSSETCSLSSVKKRWHRSNAFLSIPKSVDSDIRSSERNIEITNEIFDQNDDNNSTLLFTREFGKANNANDTTEISKNFTLSTLIDCITKDNGKLKLDEMVTEEIDSFEEPIIHLVKINSKNHTSPSTTKYMSENLSTTYSTKNSTHGNDVISSNPSIYGDNINHRISDLSQPLDLSCYPVHSTLECVAKLLQTSTKLKIEKMIAKTVSEEKSIKVVYVDHLKKFKSFTHYRIESKVQLNYIHPYLVFHDIVQERMICFHSTNHVLLLPNESMKNVSTRDINCTSTIPMLCNERNIVCNHHKINKNKYSNWSLCQPMVAIYIFDIIYPPYSTNYISSISNPNVFISSQFRSWFDTFDTFKSLNSNYIHKPHLSKHFITSSLMATYGNSQLTTSNNKRICFLSSENMEDNICDCCQEIFYLGAQFPVIKTVAKVTKQIYKPLKSERLVNIKISEIITSFQSIYKRKREYTLKISPLVECKIPIKTEDQKIIYNIIINECSFQMYNNAISTSLHGDGMYRKFTGLLKHRIGKSIIKTCARNESKLPYSIMQKIDKIPKIRLKKIYRIHVCDVCAKRFFMKIELRHHYRIHLSRRYVTRSGIPG